jgi:hypothetical protein
MAGVTTSQRVSLYHSDVITVWLIVGLMLAVQWRLRSVRLEALVSAAPTWAIVLVWSFLAFGVIAEQRSG